MKTINHLFSRQAARIIPILSGFLAFGLSGIYAQNSQSVTGKLLTGSGNQAVAYANVILIGIFDSTSQHGTIADENGVFNLGPVPTGNYKLTASMIGYKPVTESIQVLADKKTDAGIIIMQDTSILLDEFVFTGDRLKAKSGNGKTTYFITKKMTDVSGTGTGILKLIPGVQIDLMQNISLEGSQHILIFVDGKERDQNYISQLSPQQIDKVEIISTPPSNYDGNITGAINIILKKASDSGLNGQLYAEIPTTASEVFIFPTYSLNYGFKKWNIYTSYNGKLTYLNLHETITRKIPTDQKTIELTSNQYLRQKDWSHRFHYGFDYFLSSHDQFNFYAFLNPYSRELDGIADTHFPGITSNDRPATRQDSDINFSTSYSLFYKHNFNHEGSELTFDATTSMLRAENSTTYSYEGSENNTANLTNILKPKLNVNSIKVDYTTSPGASMQFSTGIKGKFLFLKDRISDDFDYSGKILAAYGTIGYKRTKINLNIGLRAENSLTEDKNNFHKSVLSILPYANLRYNPATRHIIQLSCNRSITRPDIYQLNPNFSAVDPYTLSRGNPSLKPELRSTIYLEHTIQFKSNYFSSRLFYINTVDVMNNLMYISDNGSIETQVQNLGTIHKYGIQFSGTFRLGIATVNPYLQLFNLRTCGNRIAKNYGIENRNSMAFESGLSAIISIRKDLAFSFTCQYASPENQIQGNSYCDALYFLSLDKTFKKKFTLGIVSGLPFAKSFTYRGSEIEGPDFESYSRGMANLSLVPVWLKFSIQFNSGKMREKINRIKEENIILPKKGF